MHSSSAPSLSGLQKIAITILLAVVLWLPRGLALDRFVAVDERSWLTRAGNFYLALQQGDYANTFQRYHPGVTTMWLGMAGFLWRYPEYAAEAADQIGDMSEGIEGFLREHGHQPLELLAAGRTFVVLATVLILLVAFWVAVDLFGLVSALAGFVLIAFEPFLLGLTRMLHVDGLSSALIFLSLITFIRYRYHSPYDAHYYVGRRHDLVLSGVAAGLAWLTKSPALFLVPFMGLLILIDCLKRWRMARRIHWADYRRPLTDLLAWGALAVITFVLFWPAMWVAPVQSLRAILSAAGESAATGHSKALYYYGQTYTGDPGVWFYPITYLWRTTPVVLAGLALALAGIFVWRYPFEDWRVRQAAGQLALFALLFTLFMTLGSKKFPRYLLPAYLPLNLLAGMGWVLLAFWVRDRFGALRSRPVHSAGELGQRLLLPAVLFAGLGLQAWLALSHYPYYFTYYNPLLGGSAKAPQVMMIGLGEGLDEAARYLNTKADAGQLSVASWYRGGSFNYVSNAQDLDIEDFFKADYAVIYAHQWQRQVPDKRLLDYFATLSPEHVVTIDGTDYASIYDLSDGLPPDYFTDWSQAIRLVGHDVPDQPVAPGETFVVRLHFYSVATLDENLNVIVRLVDDNGQEIGRSEGWPFGTPTSTWEVGQVYVDGHEFSVPVEAPGGYYQVQVGFYDPATQTLLTPTVAGTETPRADLLPVDYVAVGDLPDYPLAPLEADIVLGEEIRLLGGAIGSPDQSIGAGVKVATHPGANMPLRLLWQMRQYVPLDYTVLVHLIGADGQLVAQWDRQPVEGVAPTTLWRPDTTIVDEYSLLIPLDLAQGDYRLYVGMYDLATLERLPVTEDGQALGDTIHIATLAVGEPR